MSVLSSIIENHQLLIRDLARIKKKSKLLFKLYIRQIYKFATLYKYRKSKLAYPKSLQLPLTNKCNLDCVMCDIKKKENKREIPLSNFEKMLKDPIFKEVRAVGINGGEPFLVKDICERVELLAQNLKNLKTIYIISNGVLTDIIAVKLVEIKKICDKYEKKLVVSISIDGVEEIHDIVRARKGTFVCATRTIEMIQNAMEKYCHYLNIICTVSKYNVYDLPDLEVYAADKGWNISYNIATEHERLDNGEKYSNFSLLTDEKARLVACEFFYKKFVQTKSEIYYSLYKFLETSEPKRICSCQYLKSGITITPEGDVCYCATHSDKIGNIADGESIESIYFKNEEYNRELEKKFCQKCSHYMMGDLFYKDHLEYVESLVEPFYKYKL